MDNDRCRFCGEASESSSHLLSGCKVLLAEGLYTDRHNRICKYLHWTICKEYDIPVDKVWLHEPQPVTTNPTNETTIFYDHVIPAGRYILGSAVRPDIVIWDKANKNAKIIDVSVPNDYGINRAEREKVVKYQDLKNDIRETWELQDVEVIPVIVGATGILKNNLQNYLDSIPGKPNKYQAQTEALRGSISIIKRALGSKFQ